MKTLRTLGRRILDYRELGLLIALVLLLIGAGVFTPSFYSAKSLSAMLANNAVYAILALGELFVLLTGGIDISIGAVLAVSGVSVTWLLPVFPAMPLWVWPLLGLLVGALCGALNGFLVERMRMLPMIVTLGTMYAFRGLAFVLSGGKWATPEDFPASFTALAQTRVFGFRSVVLWALALFALAAFLLGLTRPGRRLYAVGASEESAEVAGINIGGAKLLSYILCGGCAGLAGVLYAANYATLSSDIGTGYEMTAIAICILGGVSIVGGRGRVDGVLIATVLMSVLTYLLSLLPGFNIWQSALQGAIILIAVAVNLLSGRFAEKRALREREASL